MKLIRQYQCDPSAEILSSDWNSDMGIVSLIRNNELKLYFSSKADEVPLPDAWSQYIFGIVAIGSNRFIAWPVGSIENGQCPIGLFGAESHSTMLMPVPKSLISNGKYVVFCYGEEWVPAQSDDTIYSDIATFYLSKDFSKCGMIGDKINEINGHGVVSEVSSCCFGSDDDFIFHRLRYDLFMEV